MFRMVNKLNVFKKFKTMLKLFFVTLVDFSKALDSLLYFYLH